MSDIMPPNLNEPPTHPKKPVEGLTPRKKGQNQGAYTTYSMWGYDYYRLDRLMRRLAIIRLKMARDPFVAYDYIAVLELIYNELRPLLSSKDRETYDRMFNEMKDLTKVELRKLSNKAKYMGKVVTLSRKLSDQFLEVEQIVRDLRQKVGMGIPTTPRYTDLKEDFLE